MTNRRLNETVAKFVGKVIASAYFTDYKIKLVFADDSAVEIYDDMQWCCEHRYMTCDDEFEDLVGGKLTEVLVRPGGCTEVDEENADETMFMEIRTDQDFVTVCTHNTHNGYYGGFDLTAKEA